MKKHPKALVKSVSNAIITGDLVVEVEYAPTFSFMESVKEMAEVYAGFLPMLKKVPYLNKTKLIEAL